MTWGSTWTTRPSRRSSYCARSSSQSVKREMVVMGSLASMIPPDDRPGTGSRDEISTSSGCSRHAPPAPEAHAGAMTTSASTPAPAAAPGTGYVLGHSSAELARLQAQARMLAGPTGAFLTLAGIRPGMHVLDLGS